MITFGSLWTYMAMPLYRDVDICYMEHKKNIWRYGGKKTDTNGAKRTTFAHYDSGNGGIPAVPAGIAQRTGDTNYPQC
ncbi:hypothetical protein GCM10009096_27920 [Parasphingorhabdus litoris]|uniref:Uncharacterized protein n=1 Tax=Parasphingorhabdus litoris TaxID=394733 RepID=A0ABN1ATZ1_9SPHN